MKCWICNPFDRLPVEAGSLGRYARLSEALADLGHSVTWWTADFSHSLKLARRADEVTPKTNCAIRLIAVRPYQKNVSLQRIRSHRDYARNLLLALSAESERGDCPDLIVVSLPPIGATAKVVHWARESAIPIVVDVQDVWPDSFRLLMPPGLLFDALSRVLFWYARRSVVRALEQADRVTATCQTYAEWAKAYGGQVEQFYYLGAASRRPGSCSTELHGIRHSGKLHVLYAGSMGRVYDLKTIIYAVAILKARGHLIRLDFAGGGQQEAALGALVMSLGLSDCVQIHGFLDRQAFDALLQSADVGVIGMHASSQVAMPNKIADYLSAGLAIANSLPGELESKLSEYGCGYSYQAGKPESLCGVLRPFLENPEMLVAAKAAACRLFDAEFDADKIYPNYASWLARIVHQLDRNELFSSDLVNK